MQTIKEEYSVLHCEHCGWKRHLLRDGTVSEHQRDAKRHERLCSSRPGVSVGDVYCAPNGGQYYWEVVAIDDQGEITVAALDNNEPDLPITQDRQKVTPCFLNVHPVRYSRVDIQPIIDKAREAYQALLNVVSKDAIDFCYCTDAGHRLTFSIAVEQYFAPVPTLSPDASRKDSEQ